MGCGRDGTVYFLRPVGADGPVKIGCSIEPERRLETYIQWSPVPLKIAATIAGGLALERRFHAAFLADQTHHEWFQASPRLTAVIDSINAGTFDPETLPAGVVLSANGSSASRHRLSSAIAKYAWMVRKGAPIPAGVREAATYRFPMTAAQVRQRHETILSFVEGQ